jgi:hypothetical protein
MFTNARLRTVCYQTFHSHTKLETDRVQEPKLRVNDHSRISHQLAQNVWRIHSRNLSSHSRHSSKLEQVSFSRGTRSTNKHLTFFPLMFIIIRLWEGNGWNDQERMADNAKYSPRNMGERTPSITWIIVTSCTLFTDNNLNRWGPREYVSLSLSLFTVLAHFTSYNVSHCDNWMYHSFFNLSPLKLV